MRFSDSAVRSYLDQAYLAHVRYSVSWSQWLLVTIHTTQLQGYFSRVFFGFSLLHADDSCAYDDCKDHK